MDDVERYCAFCHDYHLGIGRSFGEYGRDKTAGYPGVAITVLLRLSTVSFTSQGNFGRIKDVTVRSVYTLPGSSTEEILLSIINF